MGKGITITVRARMNRAARLTIATLCVCTRPFTWLHMTEKEHIAWWVNFAVLHALMLEMQRGDGTWRKL
jgi:hypothetical protein